ncbi:hypothetical protein HOA92_01280 [archaeon]|jgi:hypothetical protein|nr:hypothetical protein [archaeon]MBT6761650.1 hypothetical protein [archaeon]
MTSIHKINSENDKSNSSAVVNNNSPNQHYNKQDNMNNQKDQQKSRNFRKISTDKYIIAAILTFLIFSLGLTLGIILEDERYNWAEDINQAQDVEYLSLQLQYLFLTTVLDSNTPNKDSCTILTTSLQDSVNDLSDSLAKIVEYEEENTLPDEEFILLKRRYTLDNIRYWMLAKQAAEKCEKDFVTVLYFYYEGCPDCPSQGTVLSYYKAILEDSLLVFPIDQALASEEPLAQILFSLYEIEEFPSVVIGDTTHIGYVNKDELKELFCSEQENLSICS